MYIMHNMCLYHVANSILLDYTYSFKHIENNVYRLKTQAVFQQI